MLDKKKRGKEINHIGLVNNIINETIPFKNIESNSDSNICKIGC